MGVDPHVPSSHGLVTVLDAPIHSELLLTNYINPRIFLKISCSHRFHEVPATQMNAKYFIIPTRNHFSTIDCCKSFHTLFFSCQFLYIFSEVNKKDMSNLIPLEQIKQFPMYQEIFLVL